MYVTRDFLRSQYTSIEEFYSTFKITSCHSQIASPPSVTQTEINYEQSPARQTSVARKATSSKSIIASTVISTSSFEAKSREILPPTRKSLIAESRLSKSNTPPRIISYVEFSSSPISESPSRDRGLAFDKNLPSFSSAASPRSQLSQINGENTKINKNTSSFNSVNNFSKSNTFNSLDNIATSISFDGGNDEFGKNFFIDRLTFDGQVEARPILTPQLFLSIESNVVSTNLDKDFIIADQTLISDESTINALRKSIYLQL